METLININELVEFLNKNNIGEFFGTDDDKFEIQEITCKESIVLINNNGETVKSAKIISNRKINYMFKSSMGRDDISFILKDHQTWNCFIGIRCFSYSHTLKDGRIVLIVNNGDFVTIDELVVATRKFRNSDEAKLYNFANSKSYEKPILSEIDSIDIKPIVTMHRFELTRNDLKQLQIYGFDVDDLLDTHIKHYILHFFDDVSYVYKDKTGFIPSRKFANLLLQKVYFEKGSK